MLSTFREAGIRALIVSLLLLVLPFEFASRTGNPFGASVLQFVSLLAVLGYVSSQRRKGWLYVGIMLLCLLCFTSLFIWLDDLLLPRPRRYFATG